jgi:hypothetical protein
MAAAATAQLSVLNPPAFDQILSNTLDLLRSRPGLILPVRRGRELTRKARRLASGMPQIDQLIGGGVARGRISELTGGTGKTSLAAAFTVSAIRNGEVAAWLDLDGCCDPVSMTAAGIDLERMFWTAPAINQASAIDASAITEEGMNEEAISWMSSATAGLSAGIWRHRRDTRKRPERAMLKAAEWLMAAGGFGLIVIDFGRLRWPLRSSIAMRLARGAEQSGAALLILSERRLCGTFAALSLTFEHGRPSFSRTCPDAPVLFDGFVTDLRVARNKLGGSQRSIAWKLTNDPYVINDMADELGSAAENAPPSTLFTHDRAVS